MLKYIPGLIFTSIISLIALFISNLGIIKSTVNLSPLIISILLGLFVGNTFKINENLKPGITFSLKKILRLAIILLGFRLTFQNIIEIGLHGFLVDSIMLTSTFLFSIWISQNFFGLGKEISYLIASGCSVCGASAIIATAPIVKAENHHTAVAVGTITIFGTISMFIYPILYKTGLLVGFTDLDFGIFAGSTIHEVAQVVGAGFSVSDFAGNTATITKLTRVIMLAPLLIILSYFFSKKDKNDSEALSSFQIPWFVIGFIVMVGVNSLNIIPETGVNFIRFIDTLLFLIAMSAMGIETNINKIRNVGLKPVFSSFFIFLFLFFGGFIVTSLVKSFLAV